MKKLLAIVLLLLSMPVYAQTGVKISQMPISTPVPSNGYVPFILGGVNFRGFVPSPDGSAGDVQTKGVSGGFGSFSLNTTAGSGSSANGVLLNNSGVTQALSIGTNYMGWTNQVSPSPQAASALYQVSQGLLVDPRNYGAVCDAQYADGRPSFSHSLGTITLTNGSPTISIPGYVFKTQDIGKVISINAGSSLPGTAGVGTGTIISIGPGASQATLSVTPNVSTTGGYGVFGHDDTAGFVAAANVARLNGGAVLVPNNCAVRELTLPIGTSLVGMSAGTDYDYSYISPSMFILSTGYVEDSTSYGINITNAARNSFKGFELRGTVFPFTGSGFVGVNLACMGTDSGTPGGEADVTLDTMSLTNCFVGLGTKYPNTSQTGHIFGQSRFSMYSADAWGTRGSFSDFMEVGDIFTGNFTGGAKWLKGGGFATDAMRLVGVRFEEDGPEGALYCDACLGNHLEGTEFQFNAGPQIVLNGQWLSFWMTGGFMEYNDGASRSHVLLSGFGNFSHPIATFDNVLLGGSSSFIDSEVTAGSLNPTIAYLGGIACGDGFCNTSMQGQNAIHSGSQPLSVFKWEPGNSPKYTSGVGLTDFSVNSNHALGLSTSVARAGTIFDAGLAGTTTVTGSMIIPVGTTANRPTTGINGMMRYNSTTNAFEGYNGAWSSLGGGSGPVVVKTADYTILSTDTNSTFANTGAAGQVIFTLPTAAAALQYCFFIDTAQNFVIKADAGHTIRNGLSVTSAAGNFTSNAIGNQMCVRAINVTEWYVYSGPTGSWTVN